MLTPVAFIKGFLNLNYWVVGIPIRIKDFPNSDYTQVNFSIWEYWRLLVCYLFAGIIFFYQYVELSKSTEDIPDHTPFIRSETDLAIFVIIILTNLICSTAIFISYHQKHQEFNDYLDYFAEIPLKLRMDKCEKGKGVRKIYIKYSVIFTFIWILCFATSYLITKESWVKLKMFWSGSVPDGPDNQMWFAVFLTFFGYVFIYASPLQFGTEILVDTFLQSNGILFRFWQEDLLEQREKENKDQPSDKAVYMDNQMNMGLKLAKLTSLNNHLIGPFIIYDFTGFLVSAIGFCYTACTVFFYLDSLGESYTPAFNSLIALCLTISYLYRVWCKCDFAQQSLNARSLALKELKADVIENYNVLDRRLRWKAEIVEERLSNDDAFSPGSFFTLNRATFLPSIASAFTYFIIIIQFKLSEKSPIDVSTEDAPPPTDLF